MSDENTTSSLQIGETLTLSNEESAPIILSEREIQFAQLNLGARREQFLVEEQQLLAALGNARRSYEAKVKAAGSARGLNFEQDHVYSYNASEHTFTRTK